MPLSCMSLCISILGACLPDSIFFRNKHSVCLSLALQHLQGIAQFSPMQSVGSLFLILTYVEGEDCKASNILICRHRRSQGKAEVLQIFTFPTVKNLEVSCSYELDLHCLEHCELPMLQD